MKETLEKRINNLEELRLLEKKDIDIFITNKFKFPKDCNYLFESWKGNITFEEGIDTSNVEDMSYMFYRCDGKIKGLEHFDISNVENMSWMFYPNSIKKIDISNWNINSNCNLYNIFKIDLDTIKTIHNKNNTHDDLISTILSKNNHYNRIAQINRELIEINKLLEEKTMKILILINEDYENMSKMINRPLLTTIKNLENKKSLFQEIISNKTIIIDDN